MIKEIKRNRIPKEVLFLIGIINDTDNTVYSDNIRSSIKYNGLILFDFGFSDSTKGKIIPYYHFIAKMFGNIPNCMKSKEYIINESMLRYYVKIALENSIYNDYTLFK